MKNPKTDNNSFAPYRHNEEVEKVAKQAYIKFLSLRIDKALDSRMWITNPIEFQKLVDLYLLEKNN